MRNSHFGPAFFACLTAFLGLAGCGTGVVGGGSGGGTGGGGGGGGTTTKCSTTVARKAAPAATANYAGGAFTGKVMAGSLPVIGASVQVYASGSTGNGLAPVALGSGMTTDANGAFSLAANYSCPYNLSVVYVVAKGGKAGASGTTNSGLVLMAPVGTCGSILGGPKVVVNELTTVASAYSFAQFLTAGANLGAAATNFSGLDLAMAGEAALVNNATGTAPGASLPALATAPVALMNTLANALNACTTLATSTACSTLYAAATVGSTVPANTFDAALIIAKNPGSNIAAVYKAATGVAFAPALTVAPSDLTLFATIAGGGMNAPSGISVDSAGTVWVANYFSAVSAFTTAGAPVFTAGITGDGLLDSYGIAIDQADNIWIPNEESSYAVNTAFGSVTELNNAGQPLSGTTGYAQGGLNYPISIAVDTSGQQWVVDYGNSHLTLLNSSGVALSGTTGYTDSTIAFPVAVAVDSKCYGYLANQSGNTIVKVAPDGSSFTSYVTGSGAAGVAVDASDNVWVANYYGNSVGELLSSGTVASTGYTGGGINHPLAVAVDGAGNVWVANFRGTTITELAGAKATAPGALLSGATGFGQDAGMVEQFSIAIDAAGNVWVTNFGTNTITKFVGLASPIKTPFFGPVETP